MADKFSNIPIPFRNNEVIRCKVKWTIEKKSLHTKSKTTSAQGSVDFNFNIFDMNNEHSATLNDLHQTFVNQFITPFAMLQAKDFQWLSVTYSSATAPNKQTTTFMLPLIGLYGRTDYPADLKTKLQFDFHVEGAFQPIKFFLPGVAKAFVGFDKDVTSDFSMSASSCENRFLNPIWDLSETSRQILTAEGPLPPLKLQFIYVGPTKARNGSRRISLGHTHGNHLVACYARKVFTIAKVPDLQPVAATVQKQNNVVTKKQQHIKELKTIVVGQ